MKKKLLAIFLMITIVVFSIVPVTAAETTSTLNVSGKMYYSKAQEMLTLVNDLRSELGLSKLTLDKSLTDSAMQRAAEIAVDFSHTRPDGTSCFTAHSKMNGENIAAGNTTATDTYEQWYNSPGHYQNMTSSSYQSIGIGCFEIGYQTYWVQCFSSYSASAKDTRKNTVETTVAVNVATDDSSFVFNLLYLDSGSDLNLGYGELYQLGVDRINPGWPYVFCRFDQNSFNWKSSNTSVVTIDPSGIVTPVKGGTAEITAISKTGNLTVSITVNVYFSDVPMSHSFSKMVYWAVGKGIASGYSGAKTGIFGVNDSITRGQVVAFLWKAAGKPEPKKSTQTFTDVPVNHTFYKAIQWANEQGIAAGYTGAKKGLFGVNDSCTRGQIVTFLWKYAGKPAPKKDTQTFSDVPTSHGFYKPIQWASENRITVGYNDGTFGVNDTCTRGQCVTFLYRLLN